MERVRVGIIGCGVIAPTHAESLKRLERADLVWACDLDLDRARGLAERYGIPRTAERAEDLFADPDLDAVVVATDHASHAPLTVAALEHGKHVLCEKPLAAKPEQVEAMREAGRRHPRLHVGAVSQHRFDAVNQCLKSHMDGGAFGTILTASVRLRCLRTPEYYQSGAWRGRWETEGGSVLINQAIHFLDSLLWIVGGAQAVCARHANLTHQDLIETEDTLTALLALRGGGLGTIEATSSCHVTWQHHLGLTGTEGSVDLRDSQVAFASFRDPRRQEEIAAELRACRDEEGVAARKSYYGSGHAGQVADFIAAIQENRPPFVSLEDVVPTMRAVHAIYASYREGGWVEL